MAGVLIDFEGIDGSGKRTQSELLANELSRRGFRVDLYSYPDYKSPTGQQIQRFLSGDINLDVREQFSLYLSDIAKDSEVVRRQLDAGDVVIMDRYVPSTVAYQCAGHFDYESAKQIVLRSNLPSPSIVFYLDVPVEVSIQRKVEQKGKGDRFEGNAAFLREVQRLYARLMEDRLCSSNWIRLDGTLDAKVIHRSILGRVIPMLPT